MHDPGPGFAIDAREEDDMLRAVLRGELDLATAPRLCAVLDAARAERLRRVVVDLTGVDFCDSTGLRALIGASSELRVSGGRLAIACLPGGAVSRLFDMVGARESLRVFDTQQEALASVARLPT